MSVSNKLPIEELLPNGGRSARRPRVQLMAPMLVASEPQVGEGLRWRVDSSERRGVPIPGPMRRSGQPLGWYKIRKG